MEIDLVDEENQIRRIEMADVERAEENKTKKKSNRDVEFQDLPKCLDGKYFTLIEEKSDLAANKAVAKCTFCGNEISAFLTATTNLLRHIKRKHGIEETDYRKHCKNKDPRGRGKQKSDKNTGGGGTSTGIMDNFVKKINRKGDRQKIFEQNVLKYIIFSMQPLSTISDESFQKIISDLDSTITFPSRRTITRRLNDEHTRVKSSLKKALKNIPHICMTADIWSTKHKSYLGVTVHWIDPETLERCSGVVYCQRFKGSHTYDAIAEKLSKVFSQFELKQSQLTSMVTDNGSNFVKAFKVFGVDEDCISKDNEIVDDETQLGVNDQDDEDLDMEENFLDIDFLDFDGILETPTNTPVSDMDENFHFLPKHIRCFAHTLNLLGTTDFKKALNQQGNAQIKKIHESVITKCSNIWRAANKPKTSEAFKEIVENSIITPNTTRWNSLYDAVKFLVPNKDHLNALLGVIPSATKKNIAFREMDVEYMTEFVKTMKPIALSLDKLQGESYYGQAMPTLCRIKNMFVELASEPLKYCNFLLPHLITSFQSRFSKYLEFSPEVSDAILAACFHPKHKLLWVPEDRRDYVQTLCNNKVLQSQVDETPSTATNGSEDDDDDDFYSYRAQEQMKKSNNRLNLELATFFESKKKKLDMLHEFPHIKKLFIEYNTTLCSSAPVERLFSFCKLIMTPQRSVLNDKNFGALIFLKGNEKFSK